MKTIALIPAYNGEHTIASVITRTLEHGVRALVVDDGSADRTYDASVDAGAMVIRHATNRGKGHALVTGFRWALAQRLDGVISLDADGQHDPDEIPRFLRHGADADLVVGQRRLDRAVMPRTSLIGNRISTFFISLFCGRRFPDTQCGLRYYSCNFLGEIPLIGGRFETETELLIRASRLNMSIRWLPIDTIYSPGGGPHITNFDNLHDTLRVIRTVLSSPAYPRSSR